MDTFNPHMKALRVKVFQDTEKNLTRADPMLLSGEWGLETDTGRLKIGDGVRRWRALPYKIDRTLTREMVEDMMMMKAYIEKIKREKNGAY
ncbi:hypothetical protein EPICR_10295 [Candidatus Desulfarcum epimagneticum]|uniref:Major tropism determinant N-terminal domain-containing protein n=1 Tax=uncultured Desulfobacteraceae bacterium TaxID=218296 RepID=A0A484HC09_9BACT|nr:hypothetical protein EPICR_10295 [uncultured Desulfobacteraceae bacterium]